MKHFARFAGEGCDGLRLAGEWAANVIGFRAASGETIHVAREPHASERDLVIGGKFAFPLAPASVNTIMLAP